MRELTKTERTVIKSYLDRLEIADAKATAASKEWNRVSAELDLEWGHLRWDDRARRRADNIPLKDALETYGFWQREVVRASAMLQGQRAGRELLAER